MPASRVFWLSASVSLLVIAASVSDSLLVALPATQRHRDELNAEFAAKQARDKRAIDCAEQARRAGEDMGKYSNAFGPPPKVSGTSNHYNHKLDKCIVDVQTFDKKRYSRICPGCLRGINHFVVHDVVHAERDVRDEAHLYGFPE